MRRQRTNQAAKLLPAQIPKQKPKSNWFHITGDRAKTFGSLSLGIMTLITSGTQIYFLRAEWANNEADFTLNAQHENMFTGDFMEPGDGSRSVAFYGNTKNISSLQVSAVSAFAFDHQSSLEGVALPVDFFLFCNTSLAPNKPDFFRCVGQNNLRIEYEINEALSDKWPLVVPLGSLINIFEIKYKTTRGDEKFEYYLINPYGNEKGEKVEKLFDEVMAIRSKMGMISRQPTKAEILEYLADIKNKRDNSNP